MSISVSQSSRSSRSGCDARKLRYREILEDLSTLQDESNDNLECMDKTDKAVKEADILHKEGSNEERVKNPGVAYLDSRVLRAASELTVRCSEAVSGNVNTYDKNELAQHISENPEFWQFMFPQEIPVVGYLYGTFVPGPREKPVRRQVQRQQQQQTVTKEPEKVTNLESSEEDSQIVARVKRFISKWYKQNHKPLSYFHAVLDPGSFSASVENIYHVSFLVRDGFISITLEDGLPFITPVPTSSDPRQANIADENQFIVSIDMQRWQDLINAFDIRKPMMVLKKN